MPASGKPPKEQTQGDNAESARKKPTTGTSPQPYSIRFTRDERRDLNAAVKASGIPLSELVREAALERALHIRNNQGAASTRLSNAAARLATHIVNPACSLVTVEDLEENSPWRRQEHECTALEPYVASEDGGGAAGAVRPIPYSPTDIAELQRILFNCGTEFTMLLLRQLAAFGPYKQTHAAIDASVKMRFWPQLIRYSEK